MAFNTFDKVLLCLSAISLPLYILFISTIIRFRRQEPFNSPFFTLCLSLGICDIVSLINSWVLFRFPTFDWLGLGDYARAGTGDRFLAKLVVIISWECGLQQYLAVGTLAVNRLSAIVYEQVWTKKTVMMVIAMLWVLPATVLVPLLWTDFGYHIDNITGEPSFAIWLDQNIQQRYFIGLTIYNVMINLTTMVIYIVIFWHIKKHLNTVHAAGPSQIQASRTDTKLAFFGFFMFLVMAAYCFYATLMVLRPAGDMEAFNRNVMIWTAVSDVFSWCNPWLIIMFSPQVREKMWAMVCFKPHAVNVNQNVRSNQRRHPRQQSTRV